MAYGFKRAVFALPVLAMAGCVASPKDYETTPVKVETDQGTVTCQLYTDDLVVWDRAIDRPASMSVKAADSVCLAEGERRKNA